MQLLQPLIPTSSPGWEGVGAGDLSLAACLPSETPGVGADGAVSYGPPGPCHPPQCCCSVWAAGAVPTPLTWPVLGPPRTSQGLLHTGAPASQAGSDASPRWRRSMKNPNTAVVPRVAEPLVLNICRPGPGILVRSFGVQPSGCLSRPLRSAHSRGPISVYRANTSKRGKGAPGIALSPNSGGRGPLSLWLMGCQCAGERRGESGAHPFPVCQRPHSARLATPPRGRPVLPS